MKIKVVKDEQELGEIISDIFKEVITEKNKAGKSAILGLATGSSPIPVYKELIKRYEANEIDFFNTKTFNLDEYVGLGKDNKQSYRYFMDEYLFKHVNIKEENINFLNGKIKEGSENYKNEVYLYDQKIKEEGGIDLQILGIGENGHIAFNEPAGNLRLNTSVVDLSESTIEANSRFFDNISEVPNKALSMGIKPILDSKKIVLIAKGIKKAEAVSNLLNKDILTTTCPATVLLLHNDCTLILDEELYEKAKEYNR